MSHLNKKETNEQKKIHSESSDMPNSDPILKSSRVLWNFYDFLIQNLFMSHIMSSGGISNWLTININTEKMVSYSFLFYSCLLLLTYLLYYHWFSCSKYNNNFFFFSFPSILAFCKFHPKKNYIISSIERRQRRRVKKKMTWLSVWRKRIFQWAWSRRTSCWISQMSITSNVYRSNVGIFKLDNTSRCLIFIVVAAACYSSRFFIHFVPLFVLSPS